MRFLVINGPNINMLGKREPSVYGNEDYDFLCKKLENFASAMHIEIACVQSNYEGKIIEYIHSAQDNYDAIIINPAAFTHYSIAILDALKAVTVPAIEVHISNVHKREEFRHVSVTAPACVGQICGLGLYGYEAAIMYFLNKKGA